VALCEALIIQGKADWSKAVSINEESRERTLLFGVSLDEGGMLNKLSKFIDIVQADALTKAS
jgi:hypothetical protein